MTYFKSTNEIRLSGRQNYIPAVLWFKLQSQNLLPHYTSCEGLKAKLNPTLMIGIKCATQPS